MPSCAHCRQQHCARAVPAMGSMEKMRSITSGGISLRIGAWVDACSQSASNVCQSVSSCAQEVRHAALPEEIWNQPLASVLLRCLCCTQAFQHFCPSSLSGCSRRHWLAVAGAPPIVNRCYLFTYMAS